MMKILHDFWTTHKVGLLLSLVIGAVIAAPPILFHFSSAFHGVEMLKTNTEAHYVAQVQEIYDGHYGLGNPYLNEGKDDPYLFPPLGAYLMAGLGKMMFLNAVQATMVLRFVFSSLLAFFVYLATYRITREKYAGFLTAPFVLLGYSLVDPAHLFEFFRGHGWSLEKTFLDYGRPITPQIASLFFFAYLAFFWNALHDTTARWKRSAVAAIVTLGLSFYVYLFTWTYIFSLNGFLMLIYALNKDWEKVKRIAGISILAALAGIPYALHTIAISHHPAYAEASPRFGFVHTRTPNVSRLMIAVLVLVIAAYRWLQKNVRLFFLAVLGTAFFVVNEQVATGQFIFNHHYHWYYNTPLAIVLLAAIGYTVLRRYAHREWILRFITAAGIALLVLHGIVTQTVSYAATAPIVAAEQRYAPLLRWLNAETKKDSTVLASPDLAALIPALTHANVYYTGSALYTLTPTRRLLEAYLVSAYLVGAPREYIRDYLEQRRGDISGFAYGYAYYFQKNICTSCFPDAVIDEMAATYRGFSDERILALLRERRVGYIAWDKKNDPSWIVERFHLPIAATFGDIVVYTLRSSQH